MGCVYREIKVDGRNAWTLFDTGSRNTYIVRDQTQGLSIGTLPSPRGVALGGQVHVVREE